MIVNALAGKPLPVYGDGQQVRDWLYVEDHCAAIREVLARGRVGETYNIGGWNEKPNLEIVHAVCALLDELRPDPRGPLRAPRSPTSPTAPATTAATRSTPRKIERELGWRPAETFETGIAQDGALVPRQRRLGRARAERRLPRLGLDATTTARSRVKILLLGKNGQVGWELQRCARAARRASSRSTSTAPAAERPTSRDPTSLAATGARGRAAAHRQRRRLHRRRQGRERARARPRASTPTAVGVLAREAAALGAWLVHYSTDYVFDGSGSDALDARTTPTGAAQRLRPHQARRRGAGPRQRLPPPDLSHQLGLRARAAATSRKTMLRLAAEREPLTRHRRPDRRADRRRAARRRHRARAARARCATPRARRHLPRRRRRRDELARLRAPRDRVRARAAAAASRVARRRDRADPEQPPIRTPARAAAQFAPRHEQAAQRLRR